MSAAFNSSSYFLIWNYLFDNVINSVKLVITRTLHIINVVWTYLQGKKSSFKDIFVNFIRRILSNSHNDIKCDIHNFRRCDYFSDLRRVNPVSTSHIINWVWTHFQGKKSSFKGILVNFIAWILTNSHKDIKCDIHNFRSTIFLI